MQMMPNLVKKQFGIWEERRREKKNTEKQKKIEAENAVNKTMQCAQHWVSRGEVGEKTPKSKHSLNSNESENENGIYVTRRRFMAREIFQNIQQVELSWAESSWGASHCFTHTLSNRGEGEGKVAAVVGAFAAFQFRFAFRAKRKQQMGLLKYPIIAKLKRACAQREAKRKWNVSPRTNTHVELPTPPTCPSAPTMGECAKKPNEPTGAGAGAGATEISAESDVAWESSTRRAWIVMRNALCDTLTGWRVH